jgi:hypothetical protein
LFDIFAEVLDQISQMAHNLENGVLRVKINFSNVEELQTIKGVGPSVAENIRIARAISGNISNLNELREIKYVKITDEEAEIIDFEINPDLTYLSMQMDDVQITSGTQDNPTVSSTSPGIVAALSSETTTIQSLPSVLTSDVMGMIETKNAEKNHEMGAKTKTLNPKNAVSTL